MCSLCGIFHILCPTQYYCSCSDGHQFWSAQLSILFQISSLLGYLLAKRNKFALPFQVRLQSCLYQHIHCTLHGKLEPSLETFLSLWPPFSCLGLDGLHSRAAAKTTEKLKSGPAMFFKSKCLCSRS